MVLFYQHMDITRFLKDRSQFCHSLGLVQVALLYSSFSCVLSVQIFLLSGKYSETKVSDPSPDPAQAVPTCTGLLPRVF